MNQKSIFITGAAVGIGRATAFFFSKKGWFTGLFISEPSLASSLKTSPLFIKGKEGSRGKRGKSLCPAPLCPARPYSRCRRQKISEG